MLAGWSSDNKYALIGGVRAAAQLISYEIPLVMALVAVAMLPQSLNVPAIVMAQDVLDDGRHPDVLDLATQIISDQAAEIELMRSMLDS